VPFFRLDARLREEARRPLRSSSLLLFPVDAFFTLLQIHHRSS
jgi:hypothetical protein